MQRCPSLRFEVWSEIGWNWKFRMKIDFFFPSLTFDLLLLLQNEVKANSIHKYSSEQIKESQSTWTIRYMIEEIFFCRWSTKNKDANFIRPKRKSRVNESLIDIPNSDPHNSWNKKKKMHNKIYPHKNHKKKIQNRLTNIKQRPLDCDSEMIDLQIRGRKQRNRRRPEFPRRRSLIGEYKTVTEETRVVRTICAARIPYTLRMKPHRSWFSP